MTATTESPAIFDRTLLRIRRSRARIQGAETFLLDRAAEDLVERLSVVKRHFALALDLGSGGIAAQKLIAGGCADRAVILCDEYARKNTTSQVDTTLQVAGDEEALPFANGTFDLAVSLLSLQHVNDLPGTLAQVRRALKADGLFIAALLGGATLAELRFAFAQAEAEIEGGVSPHVAPFADLRDLGSLLQRAGFALPVTDTERLTVRYDNVFALMHDLRRMGATNVLRERSRKPLRRATLMRMAEIYAENFSDADGRLRASFEVIWLSGWSPHESQQQPLRPGSARMRLADALGTTEMPVKNPED